MVSTAADGRLPSLIPADWQERNDIGLVRLLLAISVIFSHAFPALTGNNDREPLYRLFPGYASFGRFAVLGFFAISGLLISQSWLSRPNLKVFVLRRLLRIWPGFAAASILVLVIVLPYATDRPSAYLASLCSARVVVGHIARAVFLQQPKSHLGLSPILYLT